MSIVNIVIIWEIGAVFILPRKVDIWLFLGNIAAK
jgi:hypothetical protein